MRNLSACKNIPTLSRTCFCVVLFAFMVVATTSLQITHVESHKNAIKYDGENTYSISLMVINKTVTSSDDTNQQASLISELPNLLIFAFTAKHLQVNASGFKSYFSFYSEFNSLAKAALISYLYQKSLP